MLRIIMALVLGAHGIGHLIGVVGAIRPGGISWGGSSESWLITPALGRVTPVVESLVFAVPTIGWVIAAAFLFGGNELWRPVAIASAVASLLAVGLFPQQLQAGSMFGAVVVNLAVLTGLLLLHWPSAEAVGA
jgi:hypothetical protein